MQQLVDQIAAGKCPKHKLTYCFVYQGTIKNNESRLMCEDCMNPQNANQLINIRKAFRFLSEQQDSMNKTIYQQQASIWQQFKQGQVQIIETIKCLEIQMEQLFNSINENQTINRLSEEFLNKLAKQQNIESIGQYLSSVIDQDKNGQYQLRSLQLENQCYLKCGEILQQYLLKLRQTNLIKQQSQVKVQNLQVINQKYQFETTQILQVQYSIYWLCFNHDETQIIAASICNILIFDLSQQGEWVQGEFSILKHDSIIWKVQFNHNSTLVASCGSDYRIFIWNKQRDGKWCIYQKLSSHKDTVYSICFNHNSTLLASGSYDETIQIHAMNYDKWEIQQVIEQAYGVYDVCFNHDTTLLASAGAIIQIWQLNNEGKWIVQQKLDGHTKAVWRIQFNSDSTQLIQSNYDNTMIIWSIDKDSIWKSEQTLSGHQDEVKKCINEQIIQCYCIQQQRQINKNMENQQ